MKIGDVTKLLKYALEQGDHPMLVALGGVPGGMDEFRSRPIVWDIRQVGVGYGQNRPVIEIVNWFDEWHNPKSNVVLEAPDGTLHDIIGSRFIESPIGTKILELLTEPYVPRHKSATNASS